MKTEKLDLSKRIERRLEMIHAHTKQGKTVRCVIEAFSVSVGTYYYWYHRYEKEGIFGLFDSKRTEPLTDEERERVIRERYFEKTERKVKQNGKVKFEEKWYHVSEKMAGETVEVRVTLRELEVWHNDTFIKRWKYWEYVPILLLQVIGWKSTCYSTSLQSIYPKVMYYVKSTELRFKFFSKQSSINFIYFL